MQIIQGIREKGAAIVIGVIALSLIGFILMDAKQQGNNIFGARSQNIGKINGSSISYDEFKKKAEVLELQQEQQYGRKPNSSQQAAIREQVWNLLTSQKIFFSESAKLGFEFTPKELETILKSDDPSNPLMREKSLVDPATGKLDIAKVNQVIANLKKANDEQQGYFAEQVIEPQKVGSIFNKYVAMVNASAYYPSWMRDKEAADKKNFANISYVAIPYGVISDSAIKVTDEEINKYVQAHKDQFKQEAGRMISFVSFSQKPDGADSSRVRTAVESLKSAFAGETNDMAFLSRNTSTIPFDSTYQPKSKFNSAVIDSIIRQPIGAVYGPYVDQNGYVLAKMLGTKSVFDSVTARHILIGTVNPQTGQPTLEDSVAKMRADSVMAAINTGADFKQMVTKYSTDEGSVANGGEYKNITYGYMVPEFNEFIFTKPVGSRGVVKTQFGYHIIEVLNQKGSSPVYKIAFMAKDIQPSEATINKAQLDANKLAAQKESKAFEEYIKKNGLQKISSNNLIKENDSRVGGDLPDARPLVRWAFEAKKGEVSDVYNMVDKFVVAVVDKIYKEGTQDAETARPMVENVVRNQKKAEQIIKNLGANPTLEKAAAAYGKEIQTAGLDSSLVFSNSSIQNIGFEPKLVGSVFNKENMNKVAAPLAGRNMVYVFRVNGIASKPADTEAESAAFRSQQTTALRNLLANWFEDLRKRATIKDNRSEFY